MDISSRAKYPAKALSNFASDTFVLDDVLCNSREGFLQSLKFKSPEMQEEVCKLIGIVAQRKEVHKRNGSEHKLFIGEELNIKEILMNIKIY